MAYIALTFLLPKLIKSRFLSFIQTYKIQEHRQSKRAVPDSLYSAYKLWRMTENIVAAWSEKWKKRGKEDRRRGGRESVSIYWVRFCDWANGELPSLRSHPPCILNETTMDKGIYNDFLKRVLPWHVLFGRVGLLDLFLFLPLSKGSIRDLRFQIRNTNPFD